jgi:hypothetical protein
MSATEESKVEPTHAWRAKRACSNAGLTLRKGRPTTKRYSSVLAPDMATSLPAAEAEPPVAIRSSMTRTVEPSGMASFWSSNESSPYSSVCRRRGRASGGGEGARQQRGQLKDAQVRRLRQRAGGRAATHVGDLVARAGELAGLADGDEAGAEPHGERRAEEEAPGVEADNVVDLGDLVLGEGDGVEVREEVGEEHLEVLRVAQEREEVDEGNALLREVG